MLPPEDGGSMDLRNTTWRHNTEDLELDFHRRESLKSRMQKFTSYRKSTKTN